MIRYKLDDLGWYQFEWLIQSLLKAEIGIGVQSWGGRSDAGRDAYFSGPLNFPIRSQIADGPFLFQVKFIENANAAGAKSDPLITNAVKKEIGWIEKRKQNGQWENPQHYVLLSNAPMLAPLKESIKSILENKLPFSEVHLLGSTDICDLLDKHTNLRRSFPQLLSLRDLDVLLEEAVSKELLDRSRAAIESAREVVPVFVPSSAYGRCWIVLRKNNFAVLEGPPEMGKTAIAWMIALTQISQGWQAIVCDVPEDFFQGYRKEYQQLFVADDAFGRTEYDPSRCSKWESQLDRIFRFLDKKHWLIWTSRKHILERARKVMDLQGKGSSFPSPGTVLVDASKLDLREKALILYRHARAIGLEENAKNIVKMNARMATVDSSFTPERIRRFVKDGLPKLTAELLNGILTLENVSGQIRDMIRNPTEQMRKSFRGLPLTHKWLLISLLEAGYWPEPESVRHQYEIHCPHELRKPFGDVFDELSESFVKIIEWPRPEKGWVDWAHPSYRDLVIDELVNEPSLLSAFLKGMSLSGIKIALSDSGGTAGKRRLPLMISQESWDLLFSRCREIAENNPTSEIIDLFQVLHSAATETENSKVEDRIINIISYFCDDCRKRWNHSKEVLRSTDIEAYTQASLLIHPLPSAPDFEASWQAAYDGVTSLMVKNKGGPIEDIGPLRDMVELIKAIKSIEPRFLNQVGLDEESNMFIPQLLNLVKDDFNWEASLDSPEELRAEAERYSSLAETIETLSTVISTSLLGSQELIENLKNKSTYLEETAQEMETPEQEEDEFGDKSSQESFDIEGLFSDL